MGACSSSTSGDELNESRPSRKVTFSGSHSNSFPSRDRADSSDSSTGYDVDPRFNRAPTLNRVIVFKSALADSSDEGKSDEDGDVESLEETNEESSKYSVNSDMHLEEDEKRETPFQFDWMKDLPRSPAESKRKKLSEAAFAEARK